MKLIIDENEFELQAITLQANDIIILRHPGALSPNAINNITASLERRFVGIKFMVLEEGMTVEVLRRTDELDLRCKDDESFIPDIDLTTYQK